MENKSPLLSLWYVLTGIIALGFLLIWLKAVLIPLAFSLIVSSLLFPVTQFLERRLRFPHWLAAVFTTLITILVFSAIGFFVYIQLLEIAHNFPTLAQRYEQLYPRLLNVIERFTGVAAYEQMRFIEDHLQRIIEYIVSFLQSTMVVTLELLIIIVLIPFFLFFILFYRENLKTGLMVLVQTKRGALLQHLLLEIQQVLRRYAMGELIVIATLSTLLSTTLYFLKVPNPLFWGILGGSLVILPYLGLFSTGFLCALYHTLYFEDLRYFLYIALLYFGAHLLEANFLTPYIVGSQVKLNAFVIILGLMVGAMLWGVAGMMLTVPTLAVLKVICVRIPSLHFLAYWLDDDVRLFN